LKDWIEQSYPGVGVFVSRSKNDIPAGDEWLERIKAALGEGRIFIPICGPSWLSHFWISFEMGCSWIKDIKILPICHSGQKAEGLPIPISLSQGLELEDSEFIDRLFIGISKQLGFEKVPEIDKAKMHRQLLQAAKNSVSEKPSVKKQPQLVNEHELTKEELDILLGLARSEDGLTATDLAEHFNVSTQRVTHFLDKLSSKKLVNMSANLLIGTTYFLTREGRKYLFDHGLL
jgi:DNA-binding MarR family transcriptional regulator